MWRWWESICEKHVLLREAIRTGNSYPLSGTHKRVLRRFQRAAKWVTLQVIASLGTDVEFGDVTGVFLESAELNRQGWQTFPSSAIWRSSRSSPSTTPGNTFAVVGIQWQSEEVVLEGFQFPSQHWLEIFHFGWMCLFSLRSGIQGFGRDIVFACGWSVVGWLWHSQSSKNQCTAFTFPVT